jgi:HAD superfamily hydrolase (TIGR01509 family)
VPVELVIFDMDGTLVDSRDDIIASINTGLLAVGAPARPAAEIHPLIGRPLAEMFLVLLPAGLEGRAGDAARAYRADYFENCARSSRLFPGVIECLDALGALKKAIATTKQTFQAVRVAERLGLASRFDLVHGTDGIPCKPDPAVIEQVLERLGARRERSWMVGDTIWDLRAGRAAGLRTCAVTYGIHAAGVLSAEGPDLVLDDLARLPVALEAR